MEHVAIMSLQFGDLISKILNKDKTIESRWSKNKIAPYNKINPGDTVYFKNSGGPVIAKATVSKVLQFDNLHHEKFEYIIENFGKQICLQNTKYNAWYKSKHYVTLIFLTNPQTIKPFNIDKSGFGSACAWIVTPKIKSLTLPPERWKPKT